MVVEATFDVDPNIYKSHKELPDLPAQEMLAIDIDNVRTTPEDWLGSIIDKAEAEMPGYRFEVTGEVVEE
jgi:hypothetical protein